MSYRRRGAFAPAPAVTGGYAAAVLADSPVAYYPLNGSPPVDAAGDTTATLGGAPTFGNPSLLPNGDGASMGMPNSSADHVAVSGLPALGPGPWTLETWARFDTAANFDHLIVADNWAFAFIVQAPGSAGGPYAQFELQVGASDSRLLEATLSQAVLELGRPCHLAATVDVDGTACIYVDGELGYTGVLPVGVTTKNDCHIGSCWAAASADAVQEAAIYDYALTAAQVAAHYAAAQPLAKAARPVRSKARPKAPRLRKS